MPKRTRRGRRSFADEFKAEAVALVQGSGKSVGRIAQDLDLTEPAKRDSHGDDDMIEKILHNNTLMALIVRAGFTRSGIEFFTDDDLSQQLAYMCHPAGKTIEPHIHNPVPREVKFTQEVLFIRRGRLRVDFYDDGQQYLESRLLEPGDVILLAGWGHGFEVLEEVEMIEVKQGPYAGERDKTRFAAASGDRVKIKVSE